MSTEPTIPAPDGPRSSRRTVVAILMIVFSSLGLVSSSFALVSALGEPTVRAPRTPQEGMARRIASGDPAYTRHRRTILYAEAGSGLLLWGLHLTTAIVLLRRPRGGRGWLVGYGAWAVLRAAVLAGLAQHWLGDAAESGILAPSASGFLTRVLSFCGLSVLWALIAVALAWSSTAGAPVRSA